ncbi:MAG: mismatch-specific DNA-glycosylase [Lacisediminihabitans sp.]
MGFTSEELDAFKGECLPDLIGPGLRLLLVGINPGLRTAAVQAHFGTRSNRFYAALYRAGVTDRVIDASLGFDPDDRAHLIERGVGISNLVRGASRRADELTAAELRAGAVDLTARMEALRPPVVAMLGITAYRVAFERKNAVVGVQLEPIGHSQLWVLPNPSGLNAHATLESLGAAYREAAVAAGIPVFDPPRG